MTPQEVLLAYLKSGPKSFAAISMHFCEKNDRLERMQRRADSLIRLASDAGLIEMSASGFCLTSAGLEALKGVKHG